MLPLEAVLYWLTLFSALGCALVAGVFFAFSNFVMKALTRIHPASGVAAMQSINITVLNPGFLGLFLGTAAACLALQVAALWRWPGAGAAFLLTGSTAYLIGTFLVTAVFNVPRNKALARVDGSSPESLAHWRSFIAGWTRWNHVRTIAALVAAALLATALTRLADGA